MQYTPGCLVTYLPWVSTLRDSAFLLTVVSTRWSPSPPWRSRPTHNSDVGRLDPKDLYLGALGGDPVTIVGSPEPSTEAELGPIEKNNRHLKVGVNLINFLRSWFLFFRDLICQTIVLRHFLFSSV